MISGMMVKFGGIIRNGRTCQIGEIFSLIQKHEGIIYYNIRVQLIPNRHGSMMEYVQLNPKTEGNKYLEYLNGT